MEIRLPQLGEKNEGGVIVSILVKPGDDITPGQPIVEIENEKAITTIPSPGAGRIASIEVKEGDRIPARALLLKLESKASPAPAPAPGPARVTKAPPASPPPPAAASPSAPAETTTAEAGIDADDGPESSPPPAASPYVRRVARDLGIRLSSVPATGSGGRVLVADLAAYVTRLKQAAARARQASNPPAPPAGASPQPGANGLPFPPSEQDFSGFGPVHAEPLSPIRKVIARRMLENSVTIPHVTQFDEADLTAIEHLRSTHKASFETAGVRLTPTAFLILAVARVLRRHPRFNASLNESSETLVLKDFINIGIAADTEAGLVVPVMRGADGKSLIEIAASLAELAAKARDRKLSAEEMRGGTFTISNQGTVGGGHFTPIINKPEVAILGVGRTVLRPVVMADRRIEARPMMPLALSYDHRVIDGGAAARFMVDLVQLLGNFPDADIHAGVAVRP